MSKLTKEEVISALESALSKQGNQAVTIEQKGSWYKIDGGKSMRFSELETMLGELSGDAVPATTETKVAAPKAKAVKAKTPAPKAAKKAASSAKGGKTPKELWREKLASQAGKTTLPRGF